MYAFDGHVQQLHCTKISFGDTANGGMPRIQTRSHASRIAQLFLLATEGLWAQWEITTSLPRGSAARWSRAAPHARHDLSARKAPPRKEYRPQGKQLKDVLASAPYVAPRALCCAAGRCAAAVCAALGNCLLGGAAPKQCLATVRVARPFGDHRLAMCCSARLA